jgi:hypothetical protein
MLSQRQRPVVLAVAAIAVIWLLAIAGYTIAKNTIVTANKVRAYVASVNLTGLPAPERVAAIQKLVKLLAALPLEDRQAVRMDRTAYRWLGEMTEEEKGAFIEATMPAGFKQMLSAFQQLPADRQRRVIDQTFRQLRATGAGTPSGTNGIPQINADLLIRMQTDGLNNAYSQSSAETQVELAPVLEELQRVMQTGGRFRGPDSRASYGDGRSTNPPAAKGSK